ncbi:MAG: hypothetical protein C4306_11615, partial [Thermoleophilia bacterium]
MREAPALTFTPAAIRGAVRPEDLSETSSPIPHVPVLLPPYLDAWARTSPPPDPDQPVEPFLHGIEHGQPEVSVCWRASLPSLAAWRAELSAVPVVDEETVELPLWTVRRWLGGLAQGPLSDLESVAEPDESEEVPEAPAVPAVVQRS